MMIEPLLCFSFDLDWAPEPMIDELGELIDAFGLRATVFCTHQSAAVQRLIARPGCEAGIHPNFVDGKAEQDSISELAALFPTARGARNHRLYYHSGLLRLLHDAGLTYFSNDLQFLQPDLAAHYDWSGMVRLPIYWEDDVHCSYFDGEFALDRIDLERPGLKVLSFHPVHLWLNTRSMNDYEQVKAQVRRGERLEELRRSGAGIRSLFEAVARQARGLPCRTLGELAASFRAETPYRGRCGGARGNGS